ncbi:MAG: Eco57I restriction-modification methylase domain-containing protein, partial [Thermomicrobiales bacterium]
MADRRSRTSFVAVRTEGGLLPPDLLDRIFIQDASLGGLRPVEYGLGESIRLMAVMSEAWQAVRTHWGSFSRTRDRLPANDSGTSETRSWVQQVLRELGYDTLSYRAAAETIDDRSFLISHRAGEEDNAPPIHVVSFRQELDTQGARTGGGERRSPQALMQGYLNASEHLWGMLTNGLTFRLLRENRQIDRVLRIDFDLEAMLEQENFAEFQLFWLVLNRTRFVSAGEPRETAWLERWAQTASSEGSRALEGLRDGVEKAISYLGQGLLEHPDNQHLRQQLRSGELTIQGYYQELLRLVYRLLFLMVAEERHLLFRQKPSSEQTPEERAASSQIVSRYVNHYSVERLRRESSRIRNREKHYDDLWLGLLVTFDAMRYPKEANALGIEPLAGGLFGAGSCPHIADDAVAGTTGSSRTDGRPRLSNNALLAAVSALSEVTRDGVTRRVNYRDLDVEELGGVYEGLLERQPALEALDHGMYGFHYGTSGERKSTGSFYTPRSRVQELLNSALDPVIEQALTNAPTPEAKRRALLALNVCDPACGSGHFLLGAARRIGRRLAEVKAGPGNEPDLADIRHGVREAIRQCIYGVDKNPLAIDLCKVALWIESHEPGAPISFLANHIKCGDSLIGVFDLDVLQSGIPDAAYTAVTGDDKSVAADLRKRNRLERSKLVVQGDGRTASMHNLGLWQEDELEGLLQSLATELDKIEAMPDGTIAEVIAKEHAYQRLQGRDDWRAMTTACTLWAWAFFAPRTTRNIPLVPTSSAVRQMVYSGNVRGDMIGPAIAAAEEIGFFHWTLQFPEVFARGGFDSVLGNPPWERVKLQEKEFFESRDPEIATAANKAVRARLIKNLIQSNPNLASEFKAALSVAENASLFLRTSERYPLTGRGDVNLYSIFAEHFRRMIGPTGRSGIIVPTGIATDDTNRLFFADIVNKASLATLFDFENRKKLFSSVDSRMKFSLMVLAGSARRDARFEAGFFLLDPAEIHKPDKTFMLGADDIALLNPNTRTCPIFRSVRDMELTKAIYRAAPVLVDESRGDGGNPWGVRFNRMFDMSNDSHLFHTREELEAQGAHLDPDGRFRNGDTEWLPLYEAKMAGIYDHRAADVVKSATAVTRQNQPRSLSGLEKGDPGRVVSPLYWVDANEVSKQFLNSGWAKQWFIVWRDITSATNERTFISSALPFSSAGDTLLILLPIQERPEVISCLLGNLNSFLFDFAARQKIGGVHLKFLTTKQLPVLPPGTYTEDLLSQINPRVLELTYTAHDMAPFARDLGYEGEPFVWDEDRRAQLRADLDGIYAHLYGITRDDFAYILDTFPIVARKDIAEFGEYRTKRLCLEAYDHFSPESLRTLELQVREIELALRRMIVRALDDEVEALPSHIKSKLLDEYAKHSPNGEVMPSLRTLLDSSYLTDLEKIIRGDGVWPTVADQFGSKRQFVGYVSDLNAFRNPMAHNRSVS